MLLCCFKTRKLDGPRWWMTVNIFVCQPRVQLTATFGIFSLSHDTDSLIRCDIPPYRRVQHTNLYSTHFNVKRQLLKQAAAGEWALASSRQDQKEEPGLLWVGRMKGSWKIGLWVIWKNYCFPIVYKNGHVRRILTVTVRVRMNVTFTVKCDMDSHWDTHSENACHIYYVECMSHRFLLRNSNWEFMSHWLCDFDS